MHTNDLFKTKNFSIYCNWMFKYPVKQKNFSRSFELIDFKASATWRGRPAVGKKSVQLPAHKKCCRIHFYD